MGVRKVYPGEHVQALPTPGAIIYVYTIRDTLPPMVDNQPVPDSERTANA